MKKGDNKPVITEWSATRGLKLSRKAARGNLARPVGVVSKAYIQMQKNQRAA